jgi:hypothetical protein
MSMEHIVVSVLSDGSIQADGPGAGDLLATLNRYFKVMDIVAPEDKIKEIARLAPSAQRLAVQ